MRKCSREYKRPRGAERGCGNGREATGEKQLKKKKRKKGSSEQLAVSKAEDFALSSMYSDRYPPAKKPKSTLSDRGGRRYIKVAAFIQQG
jgi:hypothetical protein